MACVTPGATKRNWVGWDRFSSVNVCATVLKSPFAGAGLPKKNGRMLLFGMFCGPPEITWGAPPWARMVVPCGIDAMRTTDAGSLGSDVCGTAAQMPGSMCSPAPVLVSLICCR